MASFKHLFSVILLFSCLHSQSQVGDLWSGNVGNLQTIYQHTDSAIFVMGDSFLIKSEDMGWTYWDKSLGAGKLLWDIDFVNDTVGFLAGIDTLRADSLKYLPAIWKTVDGGETWLNVDSGRMRSDPGLRYIGFWDEQNGIALAHYNWMWFTHDGGKTWGQHLFFYQSFSGLEILEDSSAVFTTREGQVFRTDDMGISFYSILKTPIRSVFEKELHHAGLVGNDFYFYSSSKKTEATHTGDSAFRISNSGLDRSALLSFPEGGTELEDVNHIEQVSETEAYCLRHNQILKSNHFGRFDHVFTWTTFDSFELNHIQKLADGNLLVCGENGIILRGMIPSSLESHQEKNKWEAFPQPANNMFYINSEVEIGAYRIFSLDGKLVKEEEVGEGIIRQKVCVEELNTGIFVLEVFLDGRWYSKSIEVVKEG